jgi:hypothetical protein
MGKPGILKFVGNGQEKCITLHQKNGLYYCNAKTFDITDSKDDSNMINKSEFQANKAKCPSCLHPTAPTKSKHSVPKSTKYKPTSKAKILEAETWYLRMGGCSESTMDELPKHATGVPQRFEWHPFRYIDFKEQARIRKQPVGRNPMKVAARGRHFYMDYGFIRASNEDYSRPTISKDRVVESYDGYTSYLLIVDETSKYSWIFLTKSKDPPIELTKLFMKEYANAEGDKIRCDQGGELAKSKEWRTAMLENFGYYVEPTGADSPSQNGQVENYNDTLGTIVRTLLYGANLPPKYWSAAAVHGVYLMNRRVHKTIGMTPYEAWWDELPDLSALKVFGSRVCVKVTGKRRSKLDRHNFSGIFIGYTATDDNIRYIDVDTGVTKASHHAVFDEAWYLQPSRPPMAQLLYDMGMENEIKPIQAPRLEPIPKAPYPSILNSPTKPLPKQAIQIPIPLRLSETQISPMHELPRFSHLTSTQHWKRTSSTD